MTKFIVIGLVMLMYSFITTFNWCKVGRSAIEKFKNDQFSWSRLLFYVAQEIVAAVIFTTVVYNLSTTM